MARPNITAIIMSLMIASQVSHGQSSAGNSPLPPATAHGRFDGLYVGMVIPDAVQDATKGGCTTTPYPKDVSITYDKAVMWWSSSPAFGFVSEGGSADLRSVNRVISLIAHEGGFVGRVMAGWGPWCKGSISLRRIEGQVGPPSPFRLLDGRWIGLVTPLANQPPSCPRSAFERELKIVDGVAWIGWEDGATYGYAYSDGRVILRGASRTVTLQTADGRLVGKVTGATDTCILGIELVRKI